MNTETYGSEVRPIFVFAFSNYYALLSGPKLRPRPPPLLSESSCIGQDYSRIRPPGNDVSAVVKKRFSSFLCNLWLTLKIDR